MDVTVLDNVKDADAEKAFRKLVEDGNRLIYSGDSAIIDPRGKILLEAQEETEEVITTTLDYVPLEELRRKFPVWEDADSFLLQI